MLRWTYASQFALSLFAAGMIAGSAVAQDGAWYRSGTPDVLAPSQGTAAPAALAKSFRARYVQHGSPRLTLFWMRRLSDRSVPENLTVLRIDETIGVGAASHTHMTARSRPYGRGEADGWSATALSGQRAYRREERTGPVADASDDWLPEEASVAAETALLQELRGAGVKVIDRATILRIEGAKGGANPQAIEAAALRGKVDVLAEVTALPSADSATGVLYRVDVKDVRSGLVLTSFTTPAEPRAGATASFTAKPGHGYVEATSGAPIGQELAWEMMERIAAAWGR